MLAIIVILLVSYIVIPLINLLANERAKYFAALVVYVAAFFYVVYVVWFAGVRL